MSQRNLEPAIARIGRALQAQVHRRRSLRDRAEQRLLDLVISEPAARARLFQLVDSFPALRGSDDVATHIVEYLDHESVPRRVRRAVRAAQHIPFGEQISASAARRGITHMAERFIAGTDATTARPTFERIWSGGMGLIVDLLGEKTITAGDADRYAARLRAVVASLAGDPAARPGQAGGMGGRSLAIKPTALAPRFDPLSADVGLAEATTRLRPILQAAGGAGLLVWFDMEQYRVKDLTLALFRSVVEDPSLSNLRAGIVIQTYLRDSEDDLHALLAWSARQSRPIAMRLVKGAYWDAETVLARAHGWPVPVYERKTETDACYERATRLLLAAHADGGSPVQPAFASHNVRSIAHAMAAADAAALDPGDLHFQMLYGMEGGLAAAVRSFGPQVDVYAPIGDLVPGMSYLVRRLLENSSNESFVRQSSQRAEDAALLAPPDPDPVAA